MQVEFVIVELLQRFLHFYCFVHASRHIKVCLRFHTSNYDSFQSCWEDHSCETCTKVRALSHVKDVSANLNLGSFKKLGYLMTSAGRDIIYHAAEGKRDSL